MRVDAVSVGYGRGEPVLRGVSAVAEPGRMLAVTGTSGAGKTTLLWTMAGLLGPVEGSVTVDGEPLRDRDDAVGRGVVLVPRDNGLAAILTAGENIQVSLIAAGAAPDDYSKDILTEYSDPVELTGTGEIADGEVHLHVVLGREGDEARAGHPRWANVEHFFVNAYVIPL